MVAEVILVIVGPVARMIGLINVEVDHEKQVVIDQSRVIAITVRPHVIADAEMGQILKIQVTRTEAGIGTGTGTETETIDVIVVENVNGNEAGMVVVSETEVMVVTIADAIATGITLASVKVVELESMKESETVVTE